MLKVSGQSVDVKAFSQSTKKNVVSLATPNDNGAILKKQEITPPYILDIKATGEKTIELPGADTIKASGELKKVSIFRLLDESVLARDIMIAECQERVSKNLHTPNTYKADASVSSYHNLEEKLKTGGAKAKNSYNKAFADIEASAWKEFSYKEKTLSDGAHQYMDVLQKNTGINVTNSYVANEGNEYAIEYRYGGNLCDVSKGMLDFMQSHQEHQDIWNNVVKGSYNGFDDIVAAINKTGDAATGAELKKSVTEANGTKMTFSKTSGGEMWAMALGFTRNPDDV